MESKRPRGLSLKALIVGTLGIVFACAIASHSFIIVYSTEMGGDWFPFAASIAFLIVLFGVNPLLRLVSARLELDRIDLLLVFVMVFVATPMSTAGFAATFLTNLLSPGFFATPGNHWWERLGQFLPAWLYPGDTRAITWFWTGAPPGESLPWGAWVSPLIYWALIFAALYGMMTAMVAVMRKQWVENERLIFPMMEVPLALVEDFEKGKRLPPVMRSPLFWIGLGATVAVFGSQILNRINPSFPSIRLLGNTVVAINFSETWIELRLHLFPAFIAFGFLVKRDVLLSYWLFALLIYFERNIMKTIGYSPGMGIQGEDLGHVALAWQGFGALIVFVGSGLYMARQHLRSVAAKILFDSPEVDDSREIMRYRTAAILFFVSLAIFLAFMIKMGMTAPVALLLATALLISYLAVTRFVIEGGLVLCQASVSAIACVIGLFGADSMPIASLAALTACAPFVQINRAGFMPCFANVVKLMEDENVKKGTLLKTSLFALVFGSLFCLVYYLVVCNDTGAMNSTRPLLRTSGKFVFRDVIYAMDSISAPSTVRMMWGGIGAVVMGVLTIGRYSFSWWPLHPIGFVAGTGWPGQLLLGSIFLAWAAKTILLRIGGVSLYLKSKPFFIGILIGHLIAVLVGYVCDVWIGPPGLPLYF